MSTIAPTNSATSIAATSSTATSSTTAANDPSSLATEGTFLKLLVAQIKNQDPLNPTDSTQFLGQLTQYSELEQLININTGVKQLNSPSAPATSPTSPTGSTN